MVDQRRTTSEELTGTLLQKEESCSSSTAVCSMLVTVEEQWCKSKHCYRDVTALRTNSIVTALRTGNDVN